MTQQAVVLTPKPWWQSKTVWLNLISALLLALELKFDLLQPLVPGNVYAWMSVAITVANVILRVVTASPLVFGFNKEAE
ncbi:MAG: hypothetical protein AUK53_11880 [Betaproteobacteria bacterium CG2_30_59_46]|nr:MAG: hypothetical protein AUK53_11880 [Betaproteobacteria bacterium CG2_30_59_46]